MTLWAINPAQSHDLYTVVYLLKDALRSALSDARYLERAALPKADVKGAGHAEIAAKLGRFRDSCKTLQEREALMLTKLLRARTWAVELRKLVPEIEQEIDQFIEATEPCEQMKGAFLKDAQRMFHGGGSLSRFLAQRKPKQEVVPEGNQPRLAADGSYLFGGCTALFELRAACEVFTDQINDEFFSSTPEDAPPLTEPLMKYLEAAPAEAPSAVAQAEPVH